MGLKAGQAKMSKSDPDSAVFMEDSAVYIGCSSVVRMCRSKVAGQGTICTSILRRTLQKM